jgi:hypothetical protein
MASQLCIPGDLSRIEYGPGPEVRTEVLGPQRAPERRDAIHALLEGRGVDGPAPERQAQLALGVEHQASEASRLGGHGVMDLPDAVGLVRRETQLAGGPRVEHVARARVALDLGDPRQPHAVARAKVGDLIGPESRDLGIGLTPVRSRQGRGGHRPARLHGTGEGQERHEGQQAPRYQVGAHR